MALNEASDRLNVLMLSGTSQLRGSSARTQSLAVRLPKQGVSLRIVATDSATKLPVNSVETRTARYLNWPLVGPVTCRFLASDFRSKVPTIIDIQHRSLHSAGAWFARRLQCPYVVTVHDYLRDRERFQIDQQWCQRVITVSESVKNELLERTRIPESLVTVVPSGVMPPKDSELSQLFSSGRAPVIGTAGPLEAGKGIQHFLRAAVRILKGRPDTLFVIAGSGPEERSLRRLALDLQISHAVTILPNLLDFSSALKAMDIFVLPALKQGLGSTILDAMAWGLPVIACDSGGVFSVVVDGMTGLLVPPSDDVALAERMRYLLDNPDRAREMGACGRRRIQEQFHVDHMMDATMNLYREVSRPSVTTTIPV